MRRITAIHRPIVLAVLMTIPFGFGVGALALLIHDTWREYKRDWLKIQDGDTWEYRRLSFLSDGTPIVSESGLTNRRWNDRYAHLDGKHLTAEERNQILHAQRLKDGHSVVGLRSLHDSPFDHLLDANRDVWSLQDPLQPDLYWHWERPTLGSLSVLAARDRHGSRVDLYCTADGFTPDEPPANQGFVDPVGTRSEGDFVSFRTGGQLVAVNFRKRTVSIIGPLKRDQAWRLFKRGNDEWAFAIRDGGQMTIRDEQGNVLAETAAPVTKYGRPELYTPNDGGFIVTHCPRSEEERFPEGGGMTKSQIIADRYDRTGRKIDTIEFENRYRREVREADSPIVRFIDQAITQTGAGFVAPEPAFLSAVVFLVAPYEYWHREADKPYWEIVEEVHHELRWGIPVAIVFGIACAIACWRRQKKYSAPWTKTWVAFVFLFGIPAWIAYQLHRQWPPLDLAGATNDTFVRPELNGLEIR